MSLSAADWARMEHLIEARFPGKGMKAGPSRILRAPERPRFRADRGVGGLYLMWTGGLGDLEGLTKVGFTGSFVERERDYRSSLCYFGSGRVTLWPVLESVDWEIEVRALAVLRRRYARSGCGRSEWFATGDRLGMYALMREALSDLGGWLSSPVASPRSSIDSLIW